jgi:DNA polymerase-3 subunit delta
LAQIRAAEVDRFLTRAGNTARVVLLHGNDEGLVSERASVFSDTVLAGSSDPLARISMESAAVSSDPGLLLDEANAIAMFGGSRVITLRLEGAKSIQPAIEAILAAPPAEAWIIIIGGELRKGSGLRAFCEKHPGAAVIACYADDSRALDRLIDEQMSRAGLTITTEAREVLKSLIGADRRITRSEIGKLTSYAAGQNPIGVDDVRAIVGDIAAFAVGEAVDAVALGQTDAFDLAFRRLVASGTPGPVVAGAVQRHFNFLHGARWEVDNGAPLDTVLGRARPPIFYQRRAGVKRQIGLWPVARIERALEILDTAILASRRNGNIADAIAAEALMRVAGAAQTQHRARS